LARKGDEGKDGLAQRIRQMRFDRGWGPDDLAERAEISRTALYQIESGKTEHPRAATVRRIARALGIEPNELYDSAEPSPTTHSQTSESFAALRAAPTLEPAQLAIAVAEPTQAPTPVWMRDLELECKFRRLLGSPMRDAVARIIEQTYLLLPPESRGNSN
jgi:transcriptional regulator with XRE-family HTH domain